MYPERGKIGFLSLIIVFTLFACVKAPPTPTTLPTAVTPTHAVEVRPSATPEQATITPTLPSPPTATFIPTGTPTETPTLGLQFTRTLVPPAECPPPGGEAPIISFNQNPAEYETQILTYLNARGSAVGLQSLLNNLLGTFADEPVTVTSKVFTKDVTGDNTPDVVMDVIHFYPWGNFEGYIYGFGCRNGEYVTLLKHDLCCEYLANRIQIEGLRDIQDMNRNRAPEILYSSMTMVGTHAYYSREFYILEWDGEGFVNLVQSDQEFGGARVDGDGVILDADGDGRLDLLLKNEIAPAYPDGGPQRERTDIWQWNGYVYTLSSWRYPAPVYRIQAVYDGDDSSVFGQYDRALGYYQQAIFKEDLLGWSQGQLWPDTVYEVEGTPTPDPDERPRLEAYARYRILLLHVLQGNMGAAETVYDTLITKFPPGTLGGQYAELATVFWEEYNLSGDMGSSCLMAIEYTAAHLDAILTPLGASFYNQRSYLPEEICPFE